MKAINSFDSFFLIYLFIYFFILKHEVDIYRMNRKIWFGFGFFVFKA